MAGLTVVGEAFARVGATYRDRAACEEAAGCPIARLCQNQEHGQRYRITAVRPAHHDVCTVFEGGARVVEAEPIPPVTSMLESKLKGTMAVWEPVHCVQRGCPNWDTCFNPAMEAGRRYAMRATGPLLTCPMGHRLRRVEVEPA